MARAYHSFKELCRDTSIYVLDNYLVNTDCPYCYAHHFTESTWADASRKYDCEDIQSIIPKENLIIVKPSDIL